MAEKPHLNLVFIGHVDHGKSTSVGRMLADTGNVDAYLIEKYRKMAEEKGKATFEFAWVMDSLKEERERGCDHRRRPQAVQHRQVLLHRHRRPRPPGLRQEHDHRYSPRLTPPCSSSTPEPDLRPQTKEHIFLARTLGVKQIIVGLNKMDATKPAYSEEQYKKVKEEVGKILKSIGFKVDEIPFIPYSAFKGDNATKPSTNMPWYKGPTLLDAAEQPEGGREGHQPGAQAAHPGRSIPSPVSAPSRSAVWSAVC